ncbi:hypothetical protein C8R42DRAFT_637106 [Lentinula raphanica]|nr:hypothetical protein C8R42DRAFT_637106 [Lentinula raphanica]
MNLNEFGEGEVQNMLWSIPSNTGDPFDPMNFDYTSMTNFDDFNLDNIASNTDDAFANLFADPNDPPLFLPSPSSPNLDQSSTNDSVSTESIEPSSASTTANGFSTDTPNDILSDGFFSFAPTAQIHRNPLLPTQAVRQRAPKCTLNAAQIHTMNEAKAAKRQLLQTVKVEVMKLLEEHEEKISSLAETHSVSVDLIKRMYSTASDYKHKRAAGRMQTLIHIKAQEINASRSKLKAPEIREEVKKDLALLALSDEKLEEARREVEEKRLLSLKGARPSIASTGKDFTATTERLKKEFDHLNLRTSAVGFGVLAPASRDDRGQPIWFVAGTKSTDFVRKYLNTTMWDLVGNLELWANTNKSEKPKTVAQLQSDTAAAIAAGLRYALSDKTIKMNYASYHTGIVAKYHVRLIGLPDCTIFKEANGPVKPHSINDQATLEALFTVLETGTCCWSRMSENEIKEHSAWLATQEVKERAVRSDKGKKRGSRQRDDDDDNDNDDNNKVNSENKADSRKRSQKSGANGKAGQKKSRISKQLPPRSREFINSDDDESDGTSSD